jgi:hypothetical protein
MLVSTRRLEVTIVKIAAIFLRPLLLLLLAAAVGPAQAQTRHVVVNNVRLSDQDIATLDRMQCVRIPNGHYWLNLVTGAWGYAGNPFVQGYLGDGCRANTRHKSLSERGLLYTPGDLRFR